MRATRFMRQPFYVMGHKVTEENMEAIARWCEGHVIRDTDRPFIRVPVDRPTNKRQTEAYVGTWVTLSRQHGAKSFKVYTEEWLDKNFISLPEDDLEGVELVSCGSDQSSSNDSKTTLTTTMTTQFQAPSI